MSSPSCFCQQFIVSSAAAFQKPTKIYEAHKNQYQNKLYQTQQYLNTWVVLATRLTTFCYCRGISSQRYSISKSLKLLQSFYQAFLSLPMTHLCSTFFLSKFNRKASIISIPQVSRLVLVRHGKTSQQPSSASGYFFRLCQKHFQMAPVVLR